MGQAKPAMPAKVAPPAGHAELEAAPPAVEKEEEEKMPKHMLGEKLFLAISTVEASARAEVDKPAVPAKEAATADVGSVDAALANAPAASVLVANTDAPAMVAAPSVADCDAKGEKDPAAHTEVAKPAMPAKEAPPAGHAALEAAPPAVQEEEEEKMQKHMLQPALAGKTTGRMLEMDNRELIILLEADTLLKITTTTASRTR